MNESRLFVGNLPYQTMDNDLQEYFAAAGVVTSVNVMLDKFTGKSRGFAFVEMTNRNEAGNAIAGLNGTELNGRALNVNEAKPREERSGRPAGGNGGFGRQRREARW